MSDDVARRLDEIGVPLLGDVDAILDSAQFIGADTVAVISSSLIGPEKLRWISWQLEGTRPAAGRFAWADRGRGASPAYPAGRRSAIAAC